MNDSYRIDGVGWIGPDRCGGLNSGLRARTGDEAELKALALEPTLFPDGIRNFGRFDAPSKILCCAVALALRDAGRPMTGVSRDDAGLLGANGPGALRACQSYFKDYLAGGRILGRGNLFIYTLATSPLAEAAIHFRLGGPCVHLNSLASSPMAMLLDTGARMLGQGAAREILLAALGAGRCLVLLLAEAPGESGSGLRLPIAALSPSATVLNPVADDRQRLLAALVRELEANP